MNALRFFERRRNRVWGARTIGSDPEWKYVNVRRLFIYIEHSIDKHTQWAVFEPNNHRLWANIRRAIEDFLLVLWRDGALLGEKPEHAQLTLRPDDDDPKRADNGCPYRKTCTRDSLRFSSLSNSLRSVMPILVSVLRSIRSLVRSRAALHLEVLALRHQLLVLERSRRPRLRLTTADRLLWVWLSRVWTGWRTTLVLVQPETVVDWHRRGFRRFWTWRSRRPTGRPTVPADVGALIRTMSQPRRPS